MAKDFKYHQITELESSIDGHGFPEESIVVRLKPVAEAEGDTSSGSGNESVGEPALHIDPDLHKPTNQIVDVHVSISLSSHN